MSSEFIDNFTIVKELGYGACATVYEVTDSQTDERYAAKVVSLEHRDQKIARKWLKWEFSLLKSLQSPYTIEVFDYYRRGSLGPQQVPCAYMTMERCCEVNLLDVILSESRFSEAAAHRLFTQIASGLQAIHNRSICHLDLKPQNILLAADRLTPKIADLGMSVAPEPFDSLLQTFRGTPNYMAPELHKRKPFQGELADVYSLGRVLLVMCTGNLLYNIPSEPNYKLLMQTPNRLWARLPRSTGAQDLSRDVKDLIYWMLYKDPRQRLTLRQVLEHPWVAQPTHNEVAEEIRDKVASAIANLPENV